ncbi:SHOCT-like domain-containing protein [Geochorda subterranea]|uniref:YvlB/LiaX N-terminal domain-containing protein n=1 Tax=Geochorda subterranea TaxID=3109564 RepID=A0ABZ1BMC8_9FIRM|nr:hypothetical protein [Limnochorda sp. LNt]WRP13922.1 hypothetical protein VLY81_10855 [Limnochorda sp. LNt]
MTVPPAVPPSPQARGESGAEDERLRILRLVQQGKVTPEQALALLDALGRHRRRGAGRAPEPARAPAGGRGRILRIRIVEDDEERVHLNIPLSLARSALRLVPARAQRYLAGVDLEALLEQVEHGASGRILVVRDDEDNGVEVTVE